MLEWVIPLLSSVIGVLSGLIGSYLIVKRTINEDKILDMVDLLSDEVLQNTDMQKKLFTIGALLGNGIKTGVGLNPRGGKFKMEDLISMGIAKFLGLSGPSDGLPFQGIAQPQTQTQKTEKVGYP